MIFKDRCKIKFYIEKERTKYEASKVNDYCNSEANPRKSIIFDTRTKIMERERRLLILILLDTQRGEKKVIISKRVDSMVESSTAPSESTVHFISTTLIEGHDELQGASLYQRKVKFTSRTPVCIFSSRIKYRLNSVNYSRCLVYWVFQ